MSVEQKGVVGTPLWKMAPRNGRTGGRSSPVIMEDQMHWTIRNIVLLSNELPGPEDLLYAGLRRWRNPLIAPALWPTRVT